MARGRSAFFSAWVVIVVGAPESFGGGAPAPVAPLIFDWQIGTCADGCPVTGLEAIVPIPHPSHPTPASDPAFLAVYAELEAAGLPLGVMLRNDTAPVTGSVEPEALAVVLSEIGALDFVFADFEGAQHWIDVLAMTDIVRTHVDPLVQLARIGNFGAYAGTYDHAAIHPSLVDRTAEHELYLASGLDVAMPVCYVFEAFAVHVDPAIWGEDVAPNPGSAIFWAPLERLSLAKRDLPDGHLLVPWISGFLSCVCPVCPCESAVVEVLPLPEDREALVQHMRLRGADGYYFFLVGDAGGSNEAYRAEMLAAWTSLDDAFTGPVTIMNLETDKQSGLQWSGVVRAHEAVVLVSNLGNEPASLALPDLFDLPRTTDVVAPGDHALFTYPLNVIEVPGEAPGIQAAIDAAGEGDLVLVSQGPWNESIDFSGKMIEVRSIAGAAQTAIVGSGLGESVVRCASGEGPGSILRGFTIIAGEPTDPGSGGGATITGASPTFIECVFNGNTATTGGGARIEDGSPTFESCTFECNSANLGGALFVAGGEPLLRNCIIDSCTASFGAGVSVTDGSTAILRRCTVFGNVATEDGGALHVLGASPTLVNCVLGGNVASCGGAIANGAGGSAMLLGCVLNGNDAGCGGAVVHEGGALDLINCTVHANTSASGWAIVNDGADFAITNSIVWGNDPPGAPPGISIASSLVRSAGGFALVERQPFLDPEGADGIPGTLDDDLTPAAQSEVIDAGNNESVPYALFDTIPSEILGGAPTAIDVLGESRFIDIPAAVDTGVGEAPLIDLGAFERQREPCPLDLNGNGGVGFSDLTIVLLNWGDCPAPCPADADGNGYVGFADLAMLLINYGPCG